MSPAPKSAAARPAVVADVAARARAHLRGPAVGFDRSHIAELREAGVTLEAAYALAEDLLGRAEAVRFRVDGLFEEFGSWAG